LSLIELLVATALLGLVITSGFALLNVPNLLRGRTLENNNKIEQYREAFNAFYRAYNQVGASSANASTIEGLGTSSVFSIRFNTSATVLTTQSTSIEIGGGNTALNDLLKFRVIPQPTETTSLCKLTTLASGSSTWNYTCPNGTYNGFTIAFENNQINELPIVMIDGRICFVNEVNNPANTIRIDTTRNDCPVPSNSAGDYAKMFTLPRLVVFSQDKLFSQGVFESFHEPRDRFGSNRYPQN
jgi:hypothetical protein